MLQKYYFCGMEQQYPSLLLERTVSELSRLPGVGRRTALRYALFLLRKPEHEVVHFAETIADMRRNIHYCTVCHNICDDEVCSICSNPRRDTSTICVVENIRDIMAIENTGQYKGVYHVLGGIISPMDGIGPNDLTIPLLINRVSDRGVKEVILALSSTMEGDTTCFYIYRKLEAVGVRISAIARGISVGDELEYADELTLARSIQNRIEYHGK